MLLAALLVLSTEARQRVVVVASDDTAIYQAPIQAFIDELGQQPSAIYNLHSRLSEAERVAAAIRREPPDAVFCLGSRACWTMATKLPNVPLVFGAILDPERYGIAGNQVTGVTMDVEPVTHITQFTSFFPEVQKIGVIRGPETNNAKWIAIAAAAVELDLELVERVVQRPGEVRRAFHQLARDQGVDAVWIPLDRTALSTESVRAVVEDARVMRVPLLVDTEGLVEVGALYSLVPDPDAIGRQAARMVRQILDGTSPAVMPREDPERLLVVLNVRTIDQAKLEFDRLMLDFVDIRVE